MNLKEIVKAFRSFYFKRHWRYDEIVSLGYNCETSFMIKNYTHELNSYVYCWAYVNDREKFIDSINNLDKVLSEEITLLPGGMFKCEKYNINFHPKMPKERLFNPDGTKKDSNVEAALVELKSRISYLSKKLVKLFKSNKKTLFLIKIKGTDLNADLDYVKELDKTMRHLYRSGKFTLCCIFEEKAYSVEMQKLETKNLKIRKVSHFSFDGTAEENNDIEGWKNIFSEFL